MTQWLYRLAQVTQDDIPGVPKLMPGPNTFNSGIKIALGLAGAIAFIIIVIGGLQYVLSQGNPQATAKAKDTIMYAFIGLLICITAFSIVTFVVSRI